MTMISGVRGSRSPGLGTEQQRSRSLGTPGALNIVVMDAPKNIYPRPMAVASDPDVVPVVSSRLTAAPVSAGFVNQSCEMSSSAMPRAFFGLAYTAGRNDPMTAEGGIPFVPECPGMGKKRLVSIGD